MLQGAKDRPNFFILFPLRQSTKWGFGEEMEKRRKFWVETAANMLRAVPAFALPRIPYRVVLIPFGFPLITYSLMFV